MLLENNNVWKKLLDLILILYDVLSMYMLFEYTCNPEFCQDFNSLMYLNLNLRNNYGLQQLYSMQKIYTYKTQQYTKVFLYILPTFYSYFN
jgi:hypothetical protein